MLREGGVCLLLLKLLLDEPTPLPLRGASGELLLMHVLPHVVQSELGMMGGVGAGALTASDHREADKEAARVRLVLAKALDDAEIFAKLLPSWLLPSPSDALASPEALRAELGAMGSTPPPPGHVGLPSSSAASASAASSSAASAAAAAAAAAADAVATDGDEASEVAAAAASASAAHLTADTEALRGHVDAFLLWYRGLDQEAEGPSQARRDAACAKLTRQLQVMMPHPRPPTRSPRSPD